MHLGGSLEVTETHIINLVTNLFLNLFLFLYGQNCLKTGTKDPHPTFSSRPKINQVSRAVGEREREASKIMGC
jgi:hypothetical protein